ncbi:related to high-affinity nickel transport protein nic1 [Cephalotrichum gorgonifer]|uniref:Nickel/cobalt efflux system n=1 Tax=Cephalotrichum gorgonifer TaxID=2041049 RepID=A0AAE8MX66_9PEZI|nr:related to high-affinity nickel transport protein nic1 [Cephalotrichum gorgonifer]
MTDTPDPPSTESTPLLPHPKRPSPLSLSRIPLIPHVPLPAPALRIITLLLLLNLLAWALAAPALASHPSLLPAAALSYVLGLRHALDADHIAAIDLSTRRLVAAGQRPVSVGTFFALGHSTIVVATCVAVAATGGALRERFGGAEEWGELVGGVVSAVVLVVFCAGNGWVLWRLVGRLRRAVREGRRRGAGGGEEEEEEEVGGIEMRGAVMGDVEGGGFLSVAFGRLFKLVDRPWKMFPLGFLFGLGFDTSSEIAILGIASIHAVKGTSIWLILIFPMLFTVGMALLDTTDGALMSSLYTSPAFSRDPLALLYYSTVLTAITVLVSAFVAAVQVLSLVARLAEPEPSPFWDFVDFLADHFDYIGAGICALFFAVGVGSILVYRPWRRRTMEAEDGEADA